MITDRQRIDSLLATYGNPLYVFRENDFKENYTAFDRVMKVAIPLSDLQGIFKPEFLQELEQYTPRPEKQ